MTLSPTASVAVRREFTRALLLLRVLGLSSSRRTGHHHLAVGQHQPRHRIARPESKLDRLPRI